MQAVPERCGRSPLALGSALQKKVLQANVLQAKVWQMIWQEKAWQEKIWQEIWQEEIRQAQVAPQALILQAPWPRLRQVLVWTVIDLAGVRGRGAGQERLHARSAGLPLQGCGLNFTDTPPRGVPPQVKATAILLYVSGLSMNRTGKLLGVSAPTIQAWIEQFAKVYQRVDETRRTRGKSPGKRSDCEQVGRPKVLEMLDLGMAQEADADLRARGFAPRTRPAG